MAPISQLVTVPHDWGGMKEHVNIWYEGLTSKKLQGNSNSLGELFKTLLTLSKQNKMNYYSPR